MMYRNMLADPVTSDVVRAAAAFAETLTAPQRAQLHRALVVDDAARWSNYPEAVLGRRGRPGLRTSTLVSHQWDALLDLLAVATGSSPDTGLDALCGHLDTDDLLLALGGRHGYGRGHFTVAFLGTPADTGRWMLLFGGHHLALTHAYRDGVLVGATPSFRGIEPFSLDGRRRLDRLEQGKQRTLAALLRSLDREQRATAALARTHHDLLLGPGADWRFPSEPEGLVAAGMRRDQRALLLTAIDAWVRDVADGPAARMLARYEADLDRTRVAFAGSTGVRAVGDYVRIDGPSVWIEFSMHDGIVCPGPHPHTVWRDKVTDYGGLHP